MNWFRNLELIFKWLVQCKYKPVIAPVFKADLPCDRAGARKVLFEGLILIVVTHGQFEADRRHYLYLNNRIAFRITMTLLNWWAMAPPIMWRWPLEASVTIVTLYTSAKISPCLMIHNV